MTDQNKSTATIDAQLEITPSSALESITRGEIDIQIRTAHQFPRSMKQFKTRALDMALIDEETAESCIYVRPVGMKGGVQQYAEGLSIRMAEIVAASYGNIRVGSMIIEQTERYVKCRGVAHDLESNFASTSECIEATVTKAGLPFSEGMRNVVAKACLAKAWRDALFKVVPRALCKPIETETRKLAAGNAQSIAKKRANVDEWIKRLGIDPARVFAALGIKGIEDVTGDMLVMLAGLKTSIKDGEVKIDEAFPELIAKGGVGSTGKNPMEAAAEASKPAKPAGETPAEEKKPLPEQPKGPTVEDLKKSILKAIGAANIGKSVLLSKLIDAGTLPQGTTWDKLTRDELIPIDEAIDSLIADINAK